MTEQKEQVLVLQAQLADAQKMIKKQAERIADLEMFASAKLGLEEMPSSESVTPTTNNGSENPSSAVSSETDQDTEIDQAFASMAPPPPRSSRYSVLK